MKIENYEFKKSSFLSLEKDAGMIVQKMLKNEDLKKLLYYQDEHCLKMPNIGPKETLSLINKQIRLVPKVSVDNEAFTYVILSFDNFTPNATNPEFRDNIVSFDILCHFDHWNLGDFQLRPYKIAGEIDSMFNGKHLTGIGELEFLGANQLVLNDELAGLTLMYSAIHGEEDKVE